METQDELARLVAQLRRAVIAIELRRGRAAAGRRTRRRVPNAQT